MKRIWPVLLIIAAAIALYFSVVELLWQHHAIRDFVPVDAQVLTAEVRRHSGKSTTYSPEVTYQYRYQGERYQSSQVLTFSQSSSRSWATEIVNRYGGPQNQGGVEAGGPKVTAYVNPAKPSEAILVREYSFMPYAFELASMAALLLGLGWLMGVIGGGRSDMLAVPLDESPTRLLMPAKSLKTGWRQSLLWLVGAAVVLVPAWVHWAVFAGQVGPLFFVVMFVVLGVFGVIVYRRWTLVRNLSDARLRVRPAPLVRGEPFTFEVEADVYATLQVKSGRVRLRCVEHYREKRGNKTSYGTRTHGEKIAVVCGPQALAAGGLLAGKGEVFIAEGELAPTTDPKSYPHYAWELWVELELEKLADYRARFPLEVV